MVRKKKPKISEDYIEVWHIENHEPGSRLWKLVMALAEEDAFNDPYANVIVTDNSNLACNEMVVD